MIWSKNIFPVDGTQIRLDGIGTGGIWLGSSSCLGLRALRWILLEVLRLPVVLRIRIIFLRGEQMPVFRGWRRLPVFPPFPNRINAAGIFHRTHSFLRHQISPLSCKITSIIFFGPQLTRQLRHRDQARHFTLLHLQHIPHTPRSPNKLLLSIINPLSKSRTRLPSQCRRNVCQTVDIPFILIVDISEIFSQ